jgi:hypothetical protein
MEHIYSKINSDTLLHAIIRSAEVEDVKFLSPPTEFLQVAALRMRKGRTFLPHKHIWKSGEERVIAQESWIVFKGLARVTLYDLNDDVLLVSTLRPGDCSVTFQGGHSYEILEDDTLVYEHKTGPYYGPEQDKELIDG